MDQKLLRLAQGNHSPHTLAPLPTQPIVSVSAHGSSLPFRNSQPQPRKASDTSSASYKRPVDVIDLVSSDEDSDAFYNDFKRPRTSASASTPTSAPRSPIRFHAVEVPIKAPYAVVPKTSNAIFQRQQFEEHLKALEGPEVTVVNEVDESSPSTTFQFVHKSIHGDGVEQVTEEIMIGCRCHKDNGRNIGCEYLYCECLEDSALDGHGKRVFPYGAGKKDTGCLRNFYLESRYHIYECNRKCNCESHCKNRKVQHGRKIPLEIFKTKNRGWGIGEFIDTYRGEIIIRKEADERQEKRSADEANYFMVYDKFCNAEAITKSEYLRDFPEKVHEHHNRVANKDWVISVKDGEEMWLNPNHVPYQYVCDGMHVGGPTRFMNHSCDPNCRLFTVSYNHFDTNLYDFAFFTLEEIPAGTELTFDYKDEDDRSIITDEEALLKKERDGYMPQKCLC
ncbi:MAG: hypothetical protein Q9186_005934, partial [Xanthomendoza sp. 1 TL-2023]